MFIRHLYLLGGVCPSAAEIVRSVIEHLTVRKVSVTGRILGQQIEVVCGRNLKPCLMWLGGKHSAIGLPDVDLELAALRCVLKGLLISSYISMATNSIVAHNAALEVFAKALESELLAFRDLLFRSPIREHNL